MATLIYYMLSSIALLSFGLYHLISTTRNYLKSPHTYTSKPFHLFPHSHPRIRNLPLHLTILSFLLSIAYHLFLSFQPDPLLKGHTPVHRFTSLQSSTLLLLFLLITLFHSLLPNDLTFCLSSAAFLLHSALSSAASLIQPSALEAHCDSISARISAVASLLCVVLAARPRLFSADAALAGLICLRGLWSLQTGLSLNAEGFIPEGCHRLLDVAAGVSGSTQCDLDESKLRAVAILDLAFLVNVVFVVVIVVVSYAVVGKSVGVRRLGSYEPLNTNASSAGESNHHTHIQMKALAGAQA